MLSRLATSAPHLRTTVRVFAGAAVDMADVSVLVRAPTSAYATHPRPAAASSNEVTQAPGTW